MIKDKYSYKHILRIILVFLLLPAKLSAQTIEPFSAAAKQSARPWVFWYWMQASVSKEGIRADLEAMKAAGIGGAYLMPIKGAANPPLFTPAVEQLSPAWWDMMRYAFRESERLGLEIGMHVSDGFALAGGPWISPALSMQKVVSSQVNITGGKSVQIKLPQPETKENYYHDIAVYAYPAQQGTENSTRNIIPQITTGLKDKTREVQTLIRPAVADLPVVAGSKIPGSGFKTDQPCWILYEFEQPFTCRNITVRTGGNNYQAQRLRVEVSDDGKNFRPAGRLNPPRHGWQDTDADVTHAIIPVTARYFRFWYDPTGSEPGAEDLDAAKWKPVLKLTGLELSSAPKINQYESKNGEMWRISERSTDAQLPATSCVPARQIIDLTKRLSADGTLNWKAPRGKWTIIRMGHTSTGHTNATGGGGVGLEADKFNRKAIRLQFDSWYGEAIRQAGPELAKKVLRIFHVDSWECGSQNWSGVFPAEFKKRRGYDLLPWLPVMAGIPVQSAEKSEAVLYDVRKTIAELVADTFYKTLAGLAKEKGLIFTAESVAPTMMSDGMLHYKNVDIPMGEFWLNSPTHDKPNDMLDAVSAAHIYGKPVIQAEAFTTVRMDWNEYPGMLKTLQDRNYALGINKLVYHVFTHNPWTDRKPGMTLDGVGLYFQRDQTWWKPGKAWVDYAARCQLLLQKGEPVTDVAVFTGEEYPRRAVLPQRLVQTLPGIFGADEVKKEEERLKNTGQPLAESPAGVNHSANMTDPKDWIDPLHGYAYDSFNPDVLMDAKVKDGRVVFPSGASYALLVFPIHNPMDPSGGRLSAAVRTKAGKLKKEGARILLTSESGPYRERSFREMGIEPDLAVKDLAGNDASKIAWTHRRAADGDIYFISNQQGRLRTLSLSFRIKDKIPVLYDAVSNRTKVLDKFGYAANRTIIPLQLEANASVFVIFRTADPVTADVTGHPVAGNSGVPVKGSSDRSGKNWPEFSPLKDMSFDWKVSFDPSLGGPLGETLFTALTDWSKHPDSLIRYYSGTAVYRKTVYLNAIPDERTWLDLGAVADLASIMVNGADLGVLWTAPFRVDISNVIKKGDNFIEIRLTNTWANRLIGDHRLPAAKRITKTTAPYRLSGVPLQEAGLLGPVWLKSESGSVK
jgi:hypothetical protein